MKCPDENEQIKDVTEVIERQTQRALDKLGVNVMVSIEYREGDEIFIISLDNDTTVLNTAVNVNMDSVYTSISELVRELIVHIAFHYHNGDWNE